MEKMLLLDKRTCNLVEQYVPEGDLLSDLVNFFSIFSAKRHHYFMHFHQTILNTCSHNNFGGKYRIPRKARWSVYNLPAS